MNDDDVSWSPIGPFDEVWTTYHAVGGPWDGSIFTGAPQTTLRVPTRRPESQEDVADINPDACAVYELDTVAKVWRFARYEH